MDMGTILLGVLIAGAAVFFTNRSIKTRKSEAEQSAETVEPVRLETKVTTPAAGGADVERQSASASKPGPGGIPRKVGHRLTAEQCRELARIHRQQMLDRQHDSRMSAAAAVAGAVAGAALMRHHDAEAQQARLDQMAAAQRAQQQSDADSYDADDDSFRDDGVDWDSDWSVDDDENHENDESGYGDYGNDDYGSYGDDSGADRDDDYGDYGSYGSDDYGGYDGGNYGGGDDYGGDDGGF